MHVCQQENFSTLPSCQRKDLANFNCYNVNYLQKPLKSGKIGAAKKSQGGNING
jgi:hypothetical protein